MATAYRPVITRFLLSLPRPSITLPHPYITLPHPYITLPHSLHHPVPPLHHRACRAPCILVFPCSQQDLPTQGPVHFAVSCRQWHALHTAEEAQRLHGTNPHSCQETDTLPSTSGSVAPVTGQAGKDEGPHCHGNM